MNERVRLAEKFAQFDDHWSPKVVGELNGQQEIGRAYICSNSSGCTCFSS